jgi:hypothetical protein
MIQYWVRRFWLWVFAPKQEGPVKGKHYLRTGSCHSCGKCCKNLYLIYEDRTLQTQEEFTKLQRTTPDYRHFKVMDKTEQGLVFQCVHLTVTGQQFSDVPQCLRWQLQSHR